MHCDFDRRTLGLSVHELLGEEWGRLFGLAAGLAWRRMQMGAAIHRELQAQLLADHAQARAEHAFCHRLQIDGWAVTVQGRADAVYPDPAGSGTVIEEIKTLALPGTRLASLDAARRLPMERQLALYCRFFEEERPDALPITARLVLVSSSDGAIETLAVPYRRDEVEAFLDRRLREILADRLAEHERRRRQRAFAEALGFPFPAMRRFQDEFVAAVTEAVDQGADALLCAPAGIGKTVGALFGALRGALREHRRLFFVTAKNTQAALVEDTLRMMLPPGAPIRAVFLASRERQCLQPDAVCHPSSCRYAEGYHERLHRQGAIFELHALSPLLTAQAMRVEGERRGLCPHALLFDLADDADIVIGDYNYVFDPGIGGALFGDRPARRDLLIIDEAHNLPGRAAGYFSPELRRRDGKLVVQALRGARAHFATALRKLVKDADAWFADLAAPYPRARLDRGEFPGQDDPSAPKTDDGAGVEVRFDAQALARLGKRADALLVGYWEWKVSAAQADFPSALLPTESGDDLIPAHDDSQPQGRPKTDAIASWLSAVQKLAQAAAWEGDEFCHLLFRERAGDRAKVLCVDPSAQIRKRLRPFHATIAMSATLQPLDYHHQALGLRKKRCLFRDFPSPFDPEKRLIRVVPTVSTRYRDRRRDASRLAAVIEGAARLHPGNYLAFFPSFAYRDQIHRLLNAEGLRVLIQDERMSDAERRGLLDVLRDRPGDATNLVLAVQGGIFSEGVDYPGDLCHGVFVIGPALPKVDIENELKKRYFEAQKGDGFAYAYLYPGLNRVVQAAGRLIRREDDRGVVLLVCRRFAGAQYAAHFPKHWYRESPRELISACFEDDIRRFWARGDTTAPAAPNARGESSRET